MTFEVSPVPLSLARAAAGEPLTDEEALALAEVSDAVLPQVLGAAAARRDLFFGRRVTFSPKVFLPLTNLCRNACDYCSFRRTPRQAGAWTMSPDDVVAWLERGRAQGCAEALFCLGDTPETAFPDYRRQLAAWDQASTVDYLHFAGRLALERGLLPHTNAGLLDEAAMARLKEVNVSLGLMLENVSPRFSQPGMPHHRAPDKRPEPRLGMIAAAGRARTFRLPPEFSSASARRGGERASIVCWRFVDLGIANTATSRKSSCKTSEPIAAPKFRMARRPRTGRTSRSRTPSRMARLILDAGGQRAGAAEPQSRRASSPALRAPA